MEKYQPSLLTHFFPSKKSTVEKEYEEWCVQHCVICYFYTHHYLNSSITSLWLLCRYASSASPSYILYVDMLVYIKCRLFYGSSSLHTQAGWQTGQFDSVQLDSIRSGVKAKRGTWVPGDGHVPLLTGLSRSHWSPGWPVFVWGCSCDGQPVDNGGSVCSAADSPGTAGRNDVPSPPPGVRNPLLLPLRSQQK